jgi:hypothetical protein
MLDLKSRVHLEKEEIAGFVVDKIFDGACRSVLDRFRQANGCVSQLHSQLGVTFYKWAWALLNDLLMPPLDGAFAFAKVDCLTLTVSKHLDFDMVTRKVKAFDKNSRILE